MSIYLRKGVRAGRGAYQSFRGASNAEVVGAHVVPWGCNLGVCLRSLSLDRLHAVLFAARSYLETYGVPKTREDLLKRRIVLQIADQTMGQEIYDRFFCGTPQPGFVAIRSNVSSAHYWAIAKGAGIGWLPTYGAAIGARVVPLELDLAFAVDVWLVYHADSASIPRVRRMIDWLIESFHSRQFPWFRDEFLHRNDLPKQYGGAPLANLFQGFVGDATRSSQA